MTVPIRPAPERLAPVPGTTLKAADLRDLLALADHQRRRHVRALHDTWGIAAGLRIDSAQHGPVVRPGVAYDRCGRLLVAPATVALPSADRLAGQRIVALRGDRAAGEPAARLVLLERDELDLGLDVVLGRVWSSDGQVVWEHGERRYVATAAPVGLASGRVRHGTVVVAKDASPHAWSAWIDVDAGFRMTPAYSVAVSAAPPASLSQTPLGTATVQVSAPAPHGFRITVRRAVPAAADFVESALRTNPDDITWIAALPQAAAGVRDPVPPTGPCTGPTSETEHR